MLAKQAMYATGLYLKLEKYERDPNNDVSFEDFQKAYNNSLVSMEILL
jgi:hypothetical protein